MKKYTNRLFDEKLKDGLESFNFDISDVIELKKEVVCGGNNE